MTSPDENKAAWEKVALFVGNILKASSFIQKVLNNMLDLAKIDSGKMVLIYYFTTLHKAWLDLTWLDLPYID